MKTKREVLEEIVKKGHCIDIMCSECPYNPSSYCAIRLRRVGAMAILRMFPEKKKPLLENGTKIKFSDGRIATLVRFEPEVDYGAIYYRLDFGDYYKSTDYLVGKTWEIVE